MVESTGGSAGECASDCNSVSDERIGEGFKALSESLGGLLGKMGAKPKPAEQSPTYYSPAELRALERLYPGIPNIEQRVDGLVKWAIGKGKRHNEVKIIVRDRLEKDLGEQRLKQWQAEAQAA
jgi:hypothetical protein